MKNCGNINRQIGTKLKNENYEKFIFNFISILFTSCGKKPEANFTWTPENPRAGVEMQFTNTSIDAKKYDWNFGDMNIGKDKDPKHTYNSLGDYIIDLTAYNGLHSDTKTVTITVIQ